MSDLTTIIAHVAADLKDVDNLAWSAAELERAVRWALHELSWALPQRATATLVAEEGVREYNLAVTGIEPLLFITEVWHPYTPGEPKCPPACAAWRLLDEDTLFLDVEAVHAGEGIRIFYARPHTIEGLDGALATSLNPEGEEVVAMGAAGHAALQRAQEAIGQVNVTAGAPRLWRDWGEARLGQFRARLNQLARREMQWRESWTAGWN
jgi:hypothetical protein